VPRAPEEIATGRLPEELGLLPTHVHLDKGCYPGQEAVARMWMLGRPRRHLAVVALPAGTEPGPVGDSGVEVTRTATVDGSTVGLALVGRGTAAGDRPDDGIEVLQLVGEGRPVPGHDPAVKRRRDR
jgi:folate-binding protein YgfZ